MNTSQINRCLKRHPCTKPQFLGVFASDQLPDVVPFRPCALVINTDPADKPGQHWVAAHFNATNGQVDYFDSYGQTPRVNAIGRFLTANSSRVNHNAKKVQSNLSSVCGQFCIYFLIRRCVNTSIADIVRPFRGTADGDAVIARWVNKRFNLKTVTFDEDLALNQLCTALGCSAAAAE